ncbi:hypothetical protein ACFS5M_14145 [Lacinutrix iliipiscaria]|uniref:Uncharacterized protein n=1 Tax=Lacinutrix iliipiscaria TaxID=1230532 RepID=A0ABW5WRF5_9FLAO
MILKFIHSAFELDLSGYKVIVNEENSWFSDRFVTRYTFPIELTLTPELNVVFGDILRGTSLSIETYFVGDLYYNGKVHEAILEIEEDKGLDISITIKFGLEEIPNYNKKLKELPLETVDLSETTIYAHAETIIIQSYPAVNYNFVQVHTNKYDTESEQWAYFEGVINKRVDGAFLENTFNEEESISENRNIMQPQPYLMHVIKTAVEDAGYELAGTFKDDPDFKQALFSEMSLYYSAINANSQELFFGMQDFTSEDDGPYLHPWFVGSFGPYKYGHYSETITLTDHGRYKIAGNLIRRRIGPAYIGIKFNGEIILNYERTSYSRIRVRHHQIDLNVDFNGGSGVIEVFSYQLSRYIDDEGESITEESIADLTISQIAKYDESGDLITTLVAAEDIVLTECVPDITFGELMTMLKNWKNIDIEIIDNQFYINSVVDKLLSSEVINLEPYEVNAPLRSHSKGDSFLLQFKEINSEIYTYTKVFIDQYGALLDGFVTNDDTTEITINGLPLPIATINNITTADHFLDDKTTVKLILFDGSTSENLAQSNERLLLPSVFYEDHEKWLELRIISKLTNWQFLMTEEDALELKLKNHAYAYKQYQIIKSFTKELVKNGLWSVEINLKALS